MKNSKASVKEPAKGGAPSKVLTSKEVEQMVKRDLNACLLMLQSVYEDQDVLTALALVLHGKYMNARHKEELAKQQEIPAAGSFPRDPND